MRNIIIKLTLSLLITAAVPSQVMAALTWKPVRLKTCAGPLCLEGLNLKPKICVGNFCYENKKKKKKKVKVENKDTNYKKADEQDFSAGKQANVSFNTYFEMIETQGSAPKKINEKEILQTKKGNYAVLQFVRSGAFAEQYKIVKTENMLILNEDSFVKFNSLKCDAFYLDKGPWMIEILPVISLELKRGSLILSFEKKSQIEISTEAGVLRYKDGQVSIDAVPENAAKSLEYDMSDDMMLMVSLKDKVCPSDNSTMLP